MAYFLRLIQSAIARRIAYVLVAAVFGFIASYAQADEYTSIKRYGFSDYSGFQDFDRQLVADTYITRRNVAVTTSTATFLSWGNLSIDSSGNGQQFFNLTRSFTNGASDTQAVSLTVASICPYGGTKSGLMCINAPSCPSGEVRNEAGQCSPPPINCQSTQGDIIGPVQFDSVQTTKAVACIDSCEYARHTKSAPFIRCSPDGICRYHYEVSYMGVGSECEPESPIDTPSPEPIPEQPSCAVCDCLEKGQSWGTANGIVTCFPIGSAGSNPVTKPAKPPETTTTTPAPTPENPNPEPVTTTTNAPVITVTPPPAGSPPGTPPTVTETTTDEGGGTITTEKDKKTFCQENPTAQICKGDDESTFNGACSGGFTCEGDAIQCAIAKEQHNRNCQLFVTTTDQSDLGNAIVNGQDPAASSNPASAENAEIIDVAGMITEESHFSNAGLSDQVISLGQFGSLTLPFSQFNQALQICGFIVLAFAYVSAGRIVGVY